MNLDNERKALEGWAYSNKWNICRYPKSDYHMKEGQYCDEFVDGAWHGWIKSANREGYKLVPVEASDHMKCVVRDFDPDIEDYANMDKSEWESLCSDIYKSMIGACDEP